ELVSDNVIHSFWVPQLGGKTDVIPGHDNTMWLQADRAGQFRGECAEYCGAQHAHMDFLVVGQPNDQFQTWVAQQEQNAQTTTDALALQGQRLSSQKCVGCHLIDGVNRPNVAQIGPNLTHFGSRQLIAGWVLDNTSQNLAEWLRDPQAVKPGSDMPNLKLSQDDINELVADLEWLNERGVPSAAGAHAPAPSAPRPHRWGHEYEYEYRTERTPWQLGALRRVDEPSGGRGLKRGWDPGLPRSITKRSG